MKRIVRLTESDLSRIVRRVIRENQLLKEDEAFELMRQFDKANPGYRLESSQPYATISNISNKSEVVRYDCNTNKIVSGNMGLFQQSLPIVQKFCKVAFI
jgi:hypothetical protein